MVLCENAIRTDTCARTMVLEYRGTRVPWYVLHEYVRTWYQVPLVLWYTCTMIHVYVPWCQHTCTSSWTPYGGPRGPANSRTQGRTVTRRHRAMQALVRIQAYMLADIVVAIPAVDLALEAVV